jgi:hypothetical protein
VAKAAVISAVPPLMLQTAANPGGLPIEKFDEIRRGSPLSEAGQERDPKDLLRRTPRPRGDAQSSAQRRSAGIP